MFVRFVLCCNFCQKAGFAHFECVQTRVYKCVFRGESQVFTDYAIFERGHISQGVLSVICHGCYKSITLLITIFLLQHHFPRAAIQHKLKGFRSKLKEDVEVTSVEYKHTHWLWTLCRLCLCAFQSSVSVNCACLVCQELSYIFPVFVMFSCVMIPGVWPSLLIHVQEFGVHSH